jgi:hypothetical protein
MSAPIAPQTAMPMILPAVEFMGLTPFRRCGDGKPSLSRWYLDPAAAFNRHPDRGIRGGRRIRGRAASFALAEHGADHV